MKEETKIIILTGVIYLLTELITFPLRAIGFEISAIIGFILYFVLTYFWCKNFFWIRFGKLLSMALCGSCSLYFIVFTIKGMPFSLLPGNLDPCIRLIGIVLGAFFVKSNLVFRGLITVVALLLLCYTPRLYAGYLTYLSWGTFTGRTDILLSKPLLLENETDTLVIGENAGKIYVLDCWNTCCGYCIDAFPRYQKFYEKFKGNEKVEFYAINVHEKEIARHIYLLPSQHGCQVPVRIACDSEVIKRYGVVAVPVLLVISPEGHIVYRGSDCAEAERVLKALLYESN